AHDALQRRGHTVDGTRTRAQPRVHGRVGAERTGGAGEYEAQRVEVALVGAPGLGHLPTALENHHLDAWSEARARDVHDLAVGQARRGVDGERGGWRRRDRG